MIDWICGSSLLILLVFFIRRLFRERINSIVRYMLWGLVVIRLLCPTGLWNWNDVIPESVLDKQQRLVVDVSPEVSDLPEMNWDANTIQQNEKLQEQEIQDKENHNNDVISVSDATKVSNTPERIDLRNVFEAAGKLFQFIWLAGIVIGLLWIIAVNLRFYWILRKNRIQRMDRSEFALNVYESADLQTPCLFGVLRPAVYLTSEVWKDEKIQKMVLEHEYCHYLQGDQFWVLLRGICIAVWWWNPLVWAAANAMRTDCEQACDERVIRRLGVDQCYTYAEVLLQVAAKRNGISYDLITLTMASEKEDLKGRLCMIMKRRKNRVMSVVLASILTISAAMMCFGESENDESAGRKEDILVSISMDMAESMAKKANKSYMSMYTASEEVQKAVEPLQKSVEGQAPAEVYLYKIDEESLEENPVEAVYSDEELIAACVRAFASLQNSEMGAYTLAASSVLTDSITYPAPKGQDGVWAVKLVYPEHATVFTSFWITENGTMEVTAQPILKEEIVDLELYFAEGAYLETVASCEEIVYNMAEFEAIDDSYPIVNADAIKTDNESVIDCTRELAEMMQKRAANKEFADFMDISGQIRDITERCGELLNQELSAAIIWDMEEFDEMIQALTEQSGEDREVVEEAMSVDRLISTIPSMLLGNSGGAEKLAAAQIIRAGASYQAAEDAETKMVWLIYGESETEDSIVCAATFAVNDNNCISVNAVPLWMDGVIGDIVDACMNPTDEEYNREELGEQEIITNWLSTGTYIELTEK